mmetsp:Transcript_7844/g.17039  ORF Transcript_7844/g.17039 Transcript_7844/m.17039 type:complete len:215 (-) Transcript_7844:407-1051(-)
MGADTNSKQTKKNVSALSNLLGPKILTKDGIQNTNSVLRGRDLVALYFSASWCPPCKQFSPILAEFYEHARSSKLGLEVVFVSSDKDETSFAKYYKTQPWTALPYGVEEIRKLGLDFKLKGIPTLVILDQKTGKFVNKTGRDDVLNCRTGVGKMDPAAVKSVIEKWKATEAVSLEEANLAEAKEGILKQILFFFANRPLILFALLYFIKNNIFN